MDQLRELLKRYQEGTATLEECSLVERYFMDTIDQQTVPDNDKMRQEVYHQLNHRYQLASGRRGLLKRMPQALKYGAAALIIMAAAAWLLSDVFRKEPHTAIPESGALTAMNIGPGGNAATLTLLDGQTIELSDAQDGIVTDDGIRYRDGATIAGADASNNRMFTLTTPKGGTYQVTLADGTRVWLNAQSQLQYPPAFEDDRREVTLTGEAYFEVKHDPKKPFYIHTDAQRIHVLGTSFNVSAYAGDPDQKTTLVSGRVRVSDPNRAAVLLLMPGDQSKQSNGMLTKASVNVTDVIAWKEGRFSFEHKTFEQVMAELARWYNLEIHYEGTIPQLEFFGGIKRDNNLATVLALLENSDVRYRLEADRRLIIQHQTPTVN